MPSTSCPTNYSHCRKSIKIPFRRLRRWVEDNSWHCWELPRRGGFPRFSTGGRGWSTQVWRARAFSGVWINENATYLGTFRENRNQAYSSSISLSVCPSIRPNVCSFFCLSTLPEGAAKPSNGWVVSRTAVVHSRIGKENKIMWKIHNSLIEFLRTARKWFLSEPAQVFRSFGLDFRYDLSSSWNCGDDWMKCEGGLNLVWYLSSVPADCPFGERLKEESNAQFCFHLGLFVCVKNAIIQR